MTLRDYLRVLRERWKLVVAGFVLGVLAAMTMTWAATPIYAAPVTLFVSARGAGDDTTQAYQGNLLSQQKVKSYTQLVGSARIARDLESRGVPIGSSTVEATVQTGTVLLTITATDPSPERARQVADAVAEAFSALVAELEQPADGSAPAVTARIVEPATLPTSPVSPDPFANVVLGALAGLLLGLGAALARNSLDTSIKSVDGLNALLGTPSLGSIMFGPAVADRPLVVHERPGSPRWEALRHIRTNLQFVDVDNPAKTILVTSSLPSEGKTTIACDLAVTLAESGATVALVDADLRRPAVGDRLGLERAVGLTTVLIQRVTLDEALQPWGPARIAVLTSGPTPPNPSELLASEHMTGLLAELGRRFDVVVVDAPPLLPVTDAVVLGSRCDGALLVVRHGRTTTGQARAAHEALVKVSARILGTVLNGVPRARSRDLYQYQYQYSYEPTPEPLPQRSRPGPTAPRTGGRRRTDPPRRPVDDPAFGPVRAGVRGRHSGQQGVDA